MKKFLLIITVASAPLFSSYTYDQNTAEPTEDQASHMHDLVWEYFCDGKIKEANQCLFFLYFLMNTEALVNNKDADVQQ